MQRDSKSDPRFQATRARLRQHAGELYKLRRSLPKPARRFASNMIEQFYLINTPADLQRLMPFMKYERRRLDEVLRTLNDPTRGSET